MDDANRRLAGILAADVVGYSAMVGRNEPATLARMRNSVAAAVRALRPDPCTDQFGLPLGGAVVHRLISWPASRNLVAACLSSRRALRRIAGSAQWLNSASRDNA